MFDAYLIYCVIFIIGMTLGVNLVYLLKKKDE